MINFIKDSYAVVFDDELKQVLSHINTADVTWTDDDRDSLNQYKQDNPFANQILITAQTIIADKYLTNLFNDLTPSEAKVVVGTTGTVAGVGNETWHNDRVASIEDTSTGITPKHNILCLYYFDTLATGSLSIWHSKNDPDKTNVKVVYPQQGMLVLLNEMDPYILHKVDSYDKSINRYVGRFSYNVEV